MFDFKGVYNQVKTSCKYYGDFFVLCEKHEISENESFGAIGKDFNIVYGYIFHITAVVEQEVRETFGQVFPVIVRLLIDRKIRVIYQYFLFTGIILVWRVAFCRG